jgi:hypothetical protein
MFPSRTAILFFFRHWFDQNWWWPGLPRRAQLCGSKGHHFFLSTALWLCALVKLSMDDPPNISRKKKTQWENNWSGGSPIWKTSTSYILQFFLTSFLFNWNHLRADVGSFMMSTFCPRTCGGQGSLHRTAWQPPLSYMLYVSLRINHLYNHIIIYIFT